MRKWIMAAALSLGLLLPGLPAAAEDIPAGLVCENDKLRLYYDSDSELLGLENRASGYIWWSSPLDCESDPKATKPIINTLKSTAILTSWDSSNRLSAMQRSHDAAEIIARPITDGIELTYRFPSCGITIPVCCTLEDDHMTVRTETAQIREEQGIEAASLTLLSAFGAAGPEETGSFVLPDGCGALMHFNNGKEGSKSFSAKVYGNDLTAVPVTKPAVTEKILLPVYGIVREDGNAMTVIADEGCENAVLNAQVSGQTSSYNQCSFTFTLRAQDSYYMAGTYGTLTVIEPGAIKPAAISLHYYPISEKDADFTDIAQTYREYLVTEKGLTEQSESSISMHLDLWGGTMKQRSVLGIPVNTKTALTTYAQAQEITETLHTLGVEHLALIYHNWTDAGISGKVDAKAEPASILGGSGAFGKLSASLAASGDQFYPAAENTTFRSGGGYSGFFDTAIRISGAYSKQTAYGLVYGTQSSARTPRSLLSPARFRRLYSKLSKGYGARKLTGISPVSLTSALWGDYGRQNMGRCDAAKAVQDSLQSMQDNSLSIYAPACAAYALPYASYIGSVPLQSSGFDIFDEEIPFYQTVLHGLIPYAGTPINASADTDAAFLTCLAYGCEPSYTMIGAQASTLKDTELDPLFYAHAGYWTADAAAQYKIARDVLGSVTGQAITGFFREGAVTVTTYADGTKIKVDFDAKTVTVGNTLYRLHPDERSSE